MADVKPFQIRENFFGERFVITRVNENFVFYMYNNGIVCSCCKDQMIDKVITDGKYKNITSAITSPEFKLAF